MSSPAPFNTAPGAPPLAPDPAAAPPPAGRRGRGRRLALVTVAAGLVGLLAAGAGTYAAVRAANSGVGPDSCGNISCIPDLKAEKVVDALKQQGHDCQHKDRWVCTLTTGVIGYRATVSDRDGLIHAVWVQVSKPDDTEPSPSMMAYLVWFASLPFGDDPAFLPELKSWLSERVKGGKNATARIGGYQYELEVVKDGLLRLDIEGAS